MKRCIVFLLIMILGVLMVTATSDAAAGINPVVSTIWLSENINNSSMVVIDIRKVEEYREGHIPGSISLTFNAWRTMEGSLGCQLPQKDDLADTVCSVGAEKTTHLIVVGKTDTDTDRVNATRVVWTLKYAGIQHLSILEGGYNKWVREGRPITGKVTKRARSSLTCEWKDRVLATGKDVADSCAGKAAVVVVDTRPEAQFAGRTACPTVKRKGHIPGAVNLPYSLVFTKDGLFETKGRLQAVAAQYVGGDRSREIIVVCSNGQFASAWWFALSEMLEYKDVRIYDGSMEEWCCDETAPLTVVPERQ